VGGVGFEHEGPRSAGRGELVGARSVGRRLGGRQVGFQHEGPRLARRVELELAEAGSLCRRLGGRQRLAAGFWQFVERRRALTHTLTGAKARPSQQIA